MSGTKSYINATSALDMRRSLRWTRFELPSASWGWQVSLAQLLDRRGIDDALGFCRCVSCVSVSRSRAARHSAAGPLGIDVNGAASTARPCDEVDRLPYAVVDITPDALRLIPARSQGSFSGRFTDAGRRPLLTVGIGDTVSVSIFEASAGGPFYPARRGRVPATSSNFLRRKSTAKVTSLFLMPE